MISVVIPVYNEEDNILSLTQEVAAVAGSGVPIFELVYVNDASRDNTLSVLKQTKAQFPFIRILSHAVQAGQSAAMWTGVNAARQPVVVFLDGDGQNNPADIKQVFAAFQAAGGAGNRLMVAGQRVGRQDTAIKKISSRLANRIRAAALKDGTRDTGCSLKLFRREDYLRFPFFNHMHRYLPALARRDEITVLHVDVSHRARVRGVSKYGFWDRLLAGLSDLLGVMWLCHRGRAKGYGAQEIDG